MPSTLITVADTTARDALSPAVGDTVYQIDNNKINVCSALGPVVWQSYDSDGTGGYALDGSSTLTAAPLFHFDVAKINGVDTSGNPSNGAAFTTAWTSKINGLKTFAQGTASKQPTWNSSGTSSEPYLSSDGGDELPLEFRNTFTGPITGPFTFIGVVARGGSGNLALGGNSDGNTLVYPTTAADGIFMAHSGGTDYLFLGATGSDTGAHPTFASGVGNGGTAVATYDVTRLFMVVRDSTPETKLFVDGNNTNGSNVATASAEIHLDEILDSNGYRTTGNTYELAFWDSALSTADRNTLITYVNSRYGTGRNADDSDDLARATF